MSDTELTSAPPVFQLASRINRLLARLVDGLIYCVLLSPLLIWQFRSQNALALEYQANPFGIYSDGRYWTSVLAGVGASLVFSLLYEGILIKVKGATPGKMLFGLRVEPVTGGPMSWGRSIGRVLAMTLPNWVTFNLFWVLDSLWCLWDDRKQCLHDKMVKTIVVTRR